MLKTFAADGFLIDETAEFVVDEVAAGPLAGSKSWSKKNADHLRETLLLKHCQRYEYAHAQKFRFSKIN